MAKKKKEVEEAPQVDVDALLTQLTGKNDEYVFKLRRIMSEHEFPEPRQRAILADLLPKIIEGQKQGKPANILLGPVTEEANKIVFAPKPVKKAPFWLQASDLALVFLSIFGVVYAVMIYTQRNKPQEQGSNGFIQMLLMAIAAGIGLTYYNEWSRTPKKKRPSGWRVLSMAIVLVIGAALLSSLVSYIKSPLTNTMPWIAYLVMAAVGYGIHYVLKKKYHLKGMMQA